MSEDGYETLYNFIMCQKNNAQNNIVRCRERIREIEKEMSYYEGQRDEVEKILPEIEKEIEKLKNKIEEV